MDGFKRVVDGIAVFVLFPIAVLLLVDIVIAVGVQAVLVYVGALLFAWLFTAYGFPLVAGAITLSEIADGFRAQLRRERLYEGEPLLVRRRWSLFSRRAKAPGEILTGFTSRPRTQRFYEGESLPDPYSSAF